LPKGYRKPGSNASNHEVTEFMTNKYVNKKWADNDNWSHDPAWLFENKPSKFKKYVAYYAGEHGAEMPEEKSFRNKKEDESDKIKPKGGLAAPAINTKHKLATNNTSQNIGGEMNLLDFGSEQKQNNTTNNNN